MKIKPLFKNRILTLPAEVIADKLSTATKEELTVLLAVNSEQEFDPAELAARLDITEKVFCRALQTWKTLGAFEIEGEELLPVEKKTKQKTHTDGKKASKLKIHTSLPDYSSEDVAQIIETTNGCSELIDSCQQILGKMFNITEISILLGLKDHLGLENEYILLLCSHAAEMGKKTLRYVEKVAINLYDEGISTYSYLENELKMIEYRASSEAFVRKLFGLGRRALISREKDMISAWFEKYSFSREMITLAYEITVSRTREPSLNYANGILENWHTNGLKTPDDVKRADEARAHGKDGSVQKSSFDTDEFFEAALKRSYESN